MASSLGSPPPMRGKDALPGRYNVMQRITPAHAGKRSACSMLRLASRDHPRPCGEKVCTPVAIMLDPGSPPPMRGKATAVSTFDRNGRITPAHAGKRRRGRCDLSKSRDHPRPCGEKRASQSA